GQRTVYILVTKRADASTLSVVNEVKKNLGRMQSVLPEDVAISFEFDKSPYVTRAMWAVVLEGGLGAILTGLMVLLFLRDWRSVIVVVLNIPLSLLGSIVALWLTGQTLNLMTLSGLALAIGILVDEATVEVENIHTQYEHTPSIARAVRLGNQMTAVPRLLAMLCILAVFIPSFFMEGAARELFVPLSLAVGFAMIASYLLSSTFVPVMCVWLLKPAAGHAAAAGGPFERVMNGYEAVVARIVHRRGLVVPLYLVTAAGLVGVLYLSLGTAIFPPTDKGQFMLRLKAPTGTRIERTEELTQEATRLIREELGPGNVGMTAGYVGAIPTNYPSQAIHVWTGGPEEAFMKVALRQGTGVRLEDQKARLRERLDSGLKAWLAARWREDGLSQQEIDARLPGLRLSFEPGDLVSEVMSFGSAAPVEVQVSSPNMANNLAFAAQLRGRLAA